MNKTNLLWILPLMFILLVSVASATVYFNETGSGTPDYWTDVNSAFHTYGSGNLIFVDDSSTSEYITATTTQTTQEITQIDISFYINSQLNTPNLFQIRNGSTLIFDVYRNGATNRLFARDGATLTDTGATLNINTWYNLTFLHNYSSNTYKIYLNDDLKQTYSTFSNGSRINSVWCGGGGSTGQIDLYVDSFVIKDYVIIYPNATITTNSEDFNISLVSNETINYNNVNLSQTTEILSNDTRLWNITLSTNEVGYITPITYTDYNFSTNGSLNYDFIHAEYNLTFTAEQMITGNTVSDFQVALKEDNEIDTTVYSTTSISYSLKNTWDMTSLEYYDYILLKNITNVLYALSGDTSYAYYEITYTNTTVVNTTVNSVAGTTQVTKNYANPFPDEPVSTIKLYIKEQGGTGYAKDTYINYYQLKDDYNNIPYGYYNFTFIKEGYYNKLHSENYLVSNNTPITFEDVYNSILNITFKDILTNSTINTNGTFNFVIGSVNTTVSTTNGLFSIPTIQTSLTNTVSKSTNYAYLYQNITIDDMLENVTLYLYSENSVWIYAKDFMNLSTLSGFDATIFNVNYSYNASTLTDVLRINNITAGEYKVKVEKANYTSSEYFITVGSGSHQTLTAYLLSEGIAEETVFTTQNIVSLGIVDGVTIGMYKLDSSVWNLVNSQFTDITGRALFNYVAGIEYKFITHKEGFTDRVFLLKPLYSTYTVRLTPEDVETSFIDSDFLYYLDNNGLFYGDELNNFTASIISGRGTIETYELTVTNFDGTNTTVNCSNLYGCSNDFALNITGASFGDKVSITYVMDEVGADQRTYVYDYLISDMYRDRSLWAWKDQANSGELGDLERALIFTLIALVVLGVVAGVSLYAGAPTVTITGIALVFVAYTFGYIGFISLVSANIIGIGALFIILFGRGQI